MQVEKQNDPSLGYVWACTLDSGEVVYLPVELADTSHEARETVTKMIPLMSKGNQMIEQEIADRIVILTEQLGHEIAKANAKGLTVSLETWFSDGSGSIQLNRLNGEFNVEVGSYKSLTD